MGMEFTQNFVILTAEESSETPNPIHHMIVLTLQLRVQTHVFLRNL